MTNKNCDFFGILSGFNFRNCNHQDLIDTVIHYNVYIPVENNKLNQESITKNSFSTLSKEFIYNGISYKLNPKIVIEIFEYYKMQIRIFEIETMAYLRNSILTRTIDIDDKNDVLEILKKRRNLIVEKSIKYVLKLGSFTELVDQKTLYNNTHYEIIYSLLSSQEIENYLSLEIVSYKGTFLKKWEKLQSQNTQIKFYTEKILEVESSKTKDLQSNISNNPLNRIIFKHNAEQLFRFIVEKYPKQKNTAFFSYLYFFLKDNLKVLQITGNDNKDYRDFIISLYNISFKRIQNASSENQYKKIEMFKLFDEYSQDYYSLKTEQNLSKNE